MYNPFLRCTAFAGPGRIASGELRHVALKAKQAFDAGKPVQVFEDVQNELERNWDSAKANSRLAWNEAKGAVRDGWHHIERAMPGDADGDGR